MDVKKIAELAHLEISDEEIKLYTPQMASIVEYVEQLNGLDIGDIEPALGGLTAAGEATASDRDDTVRPSLGQELALDQAPDAHSGHFRVPKVLG
jgi:aspartyl-tRNA(Asn)/glutamyl-tRNA(Gln) amidotransferase subunit C